MKAHVLRLFAGFEVDRDGFADVPLKIAEPIGLSRQAPGTGRIVPGSHQSARVLAGAYADSDLIHNPIVTRTGLPDIRSR